MSLRLLSLKPLSLRLPFKRLLIDTFRKFSASGGVCQDWNWKLPKRLSKTAVEPLRIIAHRRTSRLPPIAMVAPFVSFTVTYSWSCRRLLRPIRFPTLLFAIMHCCLFQLIRLLIFSSNSSISCIRPQRLYKPAFRPPLLEQTEHCRQTIQSHLHCSRSQGLPQNLDMVASPRFP